jgi:hypothetical protein
MVLCVQLLGFWLRTGIVCKVTKNIYTLQHLKCLFWNLLAYLLFDFTNARTHLYHALLQVLYRHFQNRMEDTNKLLKLIFYSFKCLYIFGPVSISGNVFWCFGSTYNQHLVGTAVSPKRQKYFSASDPKIQTKKFGIILMKGKVVPVLSKLSTTS